MCLETNISASSSSFYLFLPRSRKAISNYTGREKIHPVDGVDQGIRGEIAGRPSRATCAKPSTMKPSALDSRRFAMGKPTPTRSESSRRPPPQRIRVAKIPAARSFQFIDLMLDIES